MNRAVIDISLAAVMEKYDKLVTKMKSMVPVY